MINVIYSIFGILVVDLMKWLIIIGSLVVVNVDGLISFGLVVKLNKIILNDSMDLIFKFLKKGEDLLKCFIVNVFMYKVMMKVFENLIENEIEELICLNKKVEILLKKSK